MTGVEADCRLWEDDPESKDAGESVSAVLMMMGCLLVTNGGNRGICLDLERLRVTLREAR